MTGVTTIITATVMMTTRPPPVVVVVVTRPRLALPRVLPPLLVSSSRTSYGSRRCARVRSSAFDQGPIQANVEASVMMRVRKEAIAVLDGAEYHSKGKWSVVAEGQFWPLRTLGALAHGIELLAASDAPPKFARRGFRPVYETDPRRLTQAGRWRSKCRRSPAQLSALSQTVRTTTHSRIRLRRRGRG